MISGYTYSPVTHSWLIENSIILEMTAGVAIRVQTTTFSPKEAKYPIEQFYFTVLALLAICSTQHILANILAIY